MREAIEVPEEAAALRSARQQSGPFSLAQSIALVITMIAASGGSGIAYHRLADSAAAPRAEIPAEVIARIKALEEARVQRDIQTAARDAHLEEQLAQIHRRLDGIDDSLKQLSAVRRR